VKRSSFEIETYFAEGSVIRNGMRVLRQKYTATMASRCSLILPTTGTPASTQPLSSLASPWGQPVGDAYAVVDGDPVFESPVVFLLVAFLGHGSSNGPGAHLGQTGIRLIGKGRGKLESVSGVIVC
jgi:hypothetical protein